MITVKDEGNREYILDKDMREKNTIPPYVISRYQVRRIFTHAGNSVEIFGHIAYQNPPYKSKRVWYGRFFTTDKVNLSIGCRWFSREEARRIKRWASRKVK